MPTSLSAAVPNVMFQILDVYMGSSTVIKWLDFMHAPSKIIFSVSEACLPSKPVKDVNSLAHLLNIFPSSTPPVVSER